MASLSTFLCPVIESSLPVSQKESHSQESRKKKKSQELPISNLTRLIKSHPSFQKSCHGELCRLTSVCTSVLSPTEVRMFMRVDQKYCEEQNTSYNISNDYKSNTQYFVGVIFQPSQVKASSNWDRGQQGSDTWWRRQPWRLWEKRSLKSTTLHVLMFPNCHECDVINDYDD